MQSGSAQVPAPPGMWNLVDGNVMTSKTSSETAPGEAHDASMAWKHCRNVARDEGRSSDLYDLLSHSVREAQYSFPPQGWPSQIRMVSPVVSEMPAMVTERYKACQTVAFCGVFPEIRRAWASVDNSLFLWRFDKWQDIPIEYSGEDQSIVAVGLVKPKSGIFIDAIRYLLVVCTTTDIVLLGVCCGTSSEKPRDDTDDRFGSTDQISIQPLPLYSVSSDNIPMVKVASSASGRIFLGGSDGHLYEILYYSTESWRQKRCRTICLTGGIKRYLPSFLPSFLVGSPQALVDIVIDNWRNILYTRSQSSVIHVYDLGIDGTDVPNKAAEIHDFLAEASKALAGREVFGRGSGDKKSSSVAYMAPIDPAESRRLQLVTVTIDGRRVYWSTTSSRSSSKKCGPRPDRMRPEIARNAMPLSTSASHAVGGHHMPARSVEVVAACYDSGALLLAETPHGESYTRIFLLSRDLTMPPVGTVTGAHVALAGLRESVAELEAPISGEACAVMATPAPSLFSRTGSLNSGLGSSIELLRGDVTALNVAPSQRFAVVTTAGVVELERLRPADVLAHILQNADRSKLELFFKAYGAPEAAAMCVQLAASGLSGTPSTVLAKAKDALDDPLLVGEAVAQDSAGNRPVSDAPHVENGRQNEEPALQLGGFDMGAVVPIAEPEWSGAHKGICMYVARLLQPAWDEPMVVHSKSSSDLLLCTVSTDGLSMLEARLRALDKFLRDFISRKKSRRGSSFHGGKGPVIVTNDRAAQPLSKRQRLEDAARLELQRTEMLASLASRTADSCFLLRTLIEHNISRLAAHLDDLTRNRLKSLRFRDWATGEDGEGIASSLIAALVSEHMGAAPGLADDLAHQLQSGCPSFFRETDRLYYNASGMLRRAEGATTASDRQGFLKDGVVLLCRVPLSVDMAHIIPRLALLRALDSAVELAARKAAAIDPANVAELGTEPGERESSRVKREQTCYSQITTMLKIIVDPSLEVQSSWEAFQKSITPDERPILKKELLRNVAVSNDPLLRESMYSTLIELNLVKDMLQIETENLEDFLIRSSGLGGSASGVVSIGPLSKYQVACGEALARLYINRKEYAAAAGVYELMASREGAIAEFPDPTLEDRISDLHAAVLQARSCGDSTLIDRLEAKSKLAIVQKNLIYYLEELLKEYGDSDETWQVECMGIGDKGLHNVGNMNLDLSKDEADGIVSDLRKSLFSIESLYNDVARPAHAWASCLELLNLSGYADARYVRQLWDLHLKGEWQKAWTSSNLNQGNLVENFSRDKPDFNNLEKWKTGLQLAAKAVSTLGEQFYPSENTFPATFVLLRLEQMAAGMWPYTIPEISLESSIFHKSFLNACAGSFELVLRAYESLLSNRAGFTELEDAQTPEMRLRLLSSVRDIVYAGFEANKDLIMSGANKIAVRKDLGILAATCESYAGEARRLPQAEGDEIGEQLDTLMGSIQQTINLYSQRYLD